MLDPRAFHQMLHSVDKKALVAIWHEMRMALLGITSSVKDVEQAQPEKKEETTAPITPPAETSKPTARVVIKPRRAAA